MLKSAYGGKDIFPTDNPLLRLPEPSGPRTIKALHTLFPPQGHDQDYDHLPEVQRELLSLSPYLWSNYRMGGESSWHFFLGNKSVNPPNFQSFFNKICDEYQLIPNKQLRLKYCEEMESLHSKLCELASEYAALFRHPEEREMAETRGVMIQILVPVELVDEICYPSEAYGCLAEIESPLSEILQKMHKNPRLYPNLQVRILVQSLYVPEHEIKVIPLGYADFFSVTQETLKKPQEMSTKDGIKMSALVSSKIALLEKLSGLFKEMIIGSPIPKKTSIV